MPQKIVTCIRAYILESLPSINISIKKNNLLVRMPKTYPDLKDLYQKI